MAKDDQRPENEETSIDVARRRLLAKAVYIPPTVIGALSLSLEGCQVASCNPTTCNPATCNPTTNPCNPDGDPCNPGGVCDPNGGACNPDLCNPAIP